jgi:hypothetical protein
LLLAGRNFNIVLRSRQVSHDARSFGIFTPQATSHKLYSDWFRLLIGEGEESFGRLSIDKLDSKDFRGRKGSVDRDSKSWRRGWVLDFLYNFLQKSVSFVLCGFEDAHIGSQEMLERKCPRPESQKGVVRGSRSDP